MGPTSTTTSLEKLKQRSAAARRAAAADKSIVTTGEGEGFGSKSGPPRLSAARSHDLNDEYLKLQENAMRLLSGGGGGGGANAATATRRNGSAETAMPKTDTGRGGRGERLPSTGNSAKGSTTTIGGTTQSGLVPTKQSESNTSAIHQFLLSPPLDEAGTLLRISERPLVCSASLGERVVLGGTDHALYEVQVRGGSGNARSSSTSTSTPTITRRLYNRTQGHTEWVTDVAYLDDGRVVSAAMDGKLCLWDAGRAVRCIELKGHVGSVSCISVLSDSVRYLHRVIIPWIVTIVCTCACVGHRNQIV